VTINVRGQMWNWEFEYLRPDATVKQTKGDAVIPVDRPVKFVLTSRDVLHSFFVPSMRVKSDAIPGHFTYVTFKPVKTGDYQIFCTEYCGQEHWNMLAKLKVVPEAEYSRWLNDRSDELAEAKLSPVELGKQIYAQKGCNACHSLNGSRLVGPSFLKIFGREGTYTDGKAYVADENYLRESILQPNKHIVASYPPNLMPVFEGQLNDRQIEALISWMRTLNGEAPAAAETKPAVDDAAMLAKLSPAERGKHWYETKICVTCHSLDGSKLVGPSFQGIYGRTAKLEGGTEVPSDDAYITESILNPMAKVAAGYAPAMPPYAGQLDEAQIADIIAFMKTVK
jgi:cytochrome c oxidase subunit 2